MGELERRGGRDITVHLSNQQHQVTLELRGVLDIRGGGVLWTDRIPHPLLIPRGLVHAIIMAPTGRKCGPVKVGMEE